MLADPEVQAVVLATPHRQHAAQVIAAARAALVSTTIDDTTAMPARLESGATVGFATLALTAPFWRVALFGAPGILQLQGVERLS